MKNDINSGQNSAGLWLSVCLVAVLFVSFMARDISGPFAGLHSWARASGACVARAHARYGFGYTKGVSTWALGDPPPQNPTRYWDHPQLSGILAGLEMKIFGINDWSNRLVSVFVGVVNLLLFIRIMRGLVRDEKEVLLTGLMVALFPLTGYFGFGKWVFFMAFTAIWSYLVIIKELKDGPEPRFIHKVILAVSLFLALQTSWLGFFYAFAIGSHYCLFRCVLVRKKPDWGLLSILFFAPVLSLLLTFTIMAAGYDWNIQSIIDLYKWRSAKGEMQQMSTFDWGAWFQKLWDFSVKDFTLPVLILSLFYLTAGQCIIYGRKKEAGHEGCDRRFPQFWLFTVPAILFLMVFRGLVWRHQYWLKPLILPLSISAAMGILLIGDIIRKWSSRLRIPVMLFLVAVIVGYSVGGTNYFYSIRWQPEQKIDMFRKLNKQIPPDKSLLSFESFIVNQHKSKGGFIRPEIAWYLDRPIEKARDFKVIQQKAQTGEYPFYLVPYHPDLKPLLARLKQHYKSEYVPGVEGKRTKEGEFLKAGMMPYMIFSLTENSGSG